jgi:hypothetical protein
MTEPPSAAKSPATGAVRTTDTPAAYAFPGDELAATSDCAAENVAGAASDRAANTLVGRKHTARRMKKKRRIAGYAAGGIERCGGGVGSIGVGWCVRLRIETGSMRLAKISMRSAMTADTAQ